jgi:hypothetical protein
MQVEGEVGDVVTRLGPFGTTATRLVVKVPAVRWIVNGRTKVRGMGAPV